MSVAAMIDELTKKYNNRPYAIAQFRHLYYKNKQMLDLYLNTIDSVPERVIVIPKSIVHKNERLEKKSTDKVVRFDEVNKDDLIDLEITSTETSQKDWENTSMKTSQKSTWTDHTPKSMKLILNLFS